MAKILELQLQHQSFQWIFRIAILEDWLFGSPCSPRDAQESSPTPQCINSSAFSLLYIPTLTSIHDYRKNHSFDSTDLCWQSNVSAFEYAVKVGHNFSSKGQVSFNFMAAVTICSDFGATKNKVSHFSTGEGNGNPLQYSCLENPVDRGAWQVTVHGVSKSRTQLSNKTPTHTHSFHCFPIYLPWSDGTRCHNLKFSECWVLSQLFYSVYFHQEAL